MSAWLIVPRDPLIFRDGKPFTGTPGERAKTIGFPYPSTIAGAVRTRSGTDPQKGFDEGKINNLLSRSIRGPFLVELNQNGSLQKRFFPAPADALIVKDDNAQIRRHALTPIKLPRDAQTDLTKTLTLVGQGQHVNEKAHDKAPRFWAWEAIEKWLIQANDDSPDIKSLGLEDLPREHRVHVSIKRESQTSEEGALFQTSGMEFVNASDGMNGAHTLAIALETDADLTAGVDTLGGERRIVNWQGIADFPLECPVREQIIRDRHCRLILATPAHFKNGYLPDYLASDLKAKVEAAALSRYQTISGWDYAAVSADGKSKGAPKPTRRLVPAGSVYFLDLTNVSNIDRYIDEVWLQAISDDAQSRRDGFGIALLGVWDGTVRDVEVKS